jgi:hypothetical protein
MDSLSLRVSCMPPNNAACAAWALASDLWFTAIRAEPSAPPDALQLRFRPRGEQAVHRHELCG